MESTSTAGRESKMTKGPAFILAVGATCAALAYGGIWMYGDGFIFNRFTGTVIYVDLPEEAEDTLDAHAETTPPGRAPRPSAADATGRDDQAAAGDPKRTSSASWSWPSSRLRSTSIVSGVPKRRPRPFTMPIATGVRPGRFDR